ncbi:MAG: hypothetical protein GY757_45485 [bacterium]|nr:hypothetical protein [bacterium]
MLSNFFDKPWNRPAAGLSESDKAVILSWSALGLRAKGRLQEAILPMKAGLELQSGHKDWENAAIVAGNLSELMLTLGNVSAAVDYARQGVTHADMSRDNYEMESNRTTLADALHLSGRLDEAENLFLEAEEMQKKDRPDLPYLHSVPGYRFCNLLLEKGAFAEVMKRAQKFFQWRSPTDSLLEISLDNLITGRARLKLAQQKEKNNNGTGSDFTGARKFLNRAVAGLRESGRYDYLPPGLLARAEYYRYIKQYDKAEEDLNETLEIAGSGGMKLYLVDYQLEKALFEVAVGNELEAAEHFKIASQLIEETGYYKRKNEITIYNQQIPR